jgi:cysteine-rich repeat protein
MCLLLGTAACGSGSRGTSDDANELQDSTPADGDDVADDVEQDVVSDVPEDPDVDEQDAPSDADTDPDASDAIEDSTITDLTEETSDTYSEPEGYCGDTTVDEGEECDDGNDIDTDGCIDCMEATCGDSYVWDGHEECDDGNGIETDGCIGCVAATCGDTYVWDGHEECDDGNGMETDGCVGCVSAFCGDTYTWVGHESCDDGNTDESDLCSNTCVYHGAYMPSLASIGYLNGQWMTVSQSGSVYLKESGGCGGYDRIHRVESDGLVTMNFLTGLASRCGGDIVAIDEGTGAEKLVFGGSSGTPWGTFIQTWNSTTGTVDQLYFQALAYYVPVAAADASRLWFGGWNGSAGNVFEVTGPSSSTLIASASPTTILYEPLQDRLLMSEQSNLNELDLSPLGTVTTIATVAGCTIGDLTVDDAGNIYAATYIPDWMGSGTPCSSGSVFQFSPDGAQQRPFIDGFGVVKALAYDPMGQRLVLYVGTTLYYVPVAS